MKNKKGQISINVLVVGVLIVCIVALSSFLFAQSKFSKQFVGFNVAEQVRADVEQFRTYEKLLEGRVVRI